MARFVSEGHKMSNLSGLEELQVPNDMIKSSNLLKIKTDLECIQGIALWERNGGGNITFHEPRHHTLSIYQCGGYGVWSDKTKTYGFSDAVCVLPEGFETKWFNSKEVVCLHLYFTSNDIEELGWKKLSSIDPKIFGRDPFLKSTSQALVSHLEWGDTTDNLTIEQIVLSLLSRIGTISEKHISALLSRKSLVYIEERLRDLENGQPSLQSLANHLNLSVRHLTRAYKQSTGNTISQRHRDIQFEKAIDLLKTDVSLSEIAYACGFGSQSHFATAFKKKFGCSPSKYLASSK